ncbi:MAG: xanthine dehydrogenase family protein subunit M [Planctomycetota bacterium]
MKAFSYTSPETWQAAARALRAAPAALPKAAGTDLLDLMKEGVLEPPELVNLLGVGLEKGQRDTLSARLTLAQLGAEGYLREQYPALAMAAGEAATPQIRNRGTLGGNLCQLPRCAYLRTGHACLRVGDTTCAAAQPGAHTRFHGVFPAQGCLSAHASNLAPALVVLGAKVEVVGPEGARTLGVEELYAPPAAGRMGDTSLAHDELVSWVSLTPSALARNSLYVEVRERQSFDFALVSLAAALEVQGGKVARARLCFGGVAPGPYRAKAAELALEGKALEPEVLNAAARAAVQGAQPTAMNEHKPTLMQRLLVRALRSLGKEGAK